MVGGAEELIRKAVRALDERLGSAPLLKKTLRYVFPDHWSFMLGEIALYCFVFLVASGIYLTFFFKPSFQHVIYHGTYAPLRGTEMTKAYESTLQISFSVKAGLLIRQAHHWAANVFVAAIVLHLMRIFFTGAFRKPRDINMWVGLTMLGLALFEGYAGYSLADDLLSGMGLAIGYSVLMSIPVAGAWLAALAWGGPFPGGEVFIGRLYIVHVLIVPLVIATLLAIHLAIIVRQKHTDFRGRGRTERNVVGTPLWPSYAFRSLGLMLGVVAVLFLLGGLFQINPVWLWGPYRPDLATNGAQPDWYIGWLIGALRLMPPLEIHVFGYTVVPNAFFGGALFPLVVFGFLYMWPAIERRKTGDRARHELLDRPRDNPWRTAVGAAFFTWVWLVFVAGSLDQAVAHLQLSYVQQIWIFRVAVIVLPIVVFFVTRAICRDLQRSELHPLDRRPRRVRRGPSGGFETIED
ncbi:MAG: ubiquinol-cytochrome c reductase cytochrome b subunit [Gaiellaceae bacterium]|nr:ubiquinol-cytochrome c reductase cytochrome b subunit [Gaiellaceae bacterium]